MSSLHLPGLGRWGRGPKCPSPIPWRLCILVICWLHSEFRGVIGATGWGTGRQVGLDLRIGWVQLGGQERRACSEASGIWEGVSIAVGSGRGRGGQTPAHPAMWRWTGCPRDGVCRAGPRP